MNTFKYKYSDIVYIFKDFLNLLIVALPDATIISVCAKLLTAL